MSAVPEVRRRCGGRKACNFNQNNHVVIQNDSPQRAGRAAADESGVWMARKGAQDELRLQLRDGGMLSGAVDENLSLESEAGYGGELAAIGA